MSRSSSQDSTRKWQSSRRYAACFVSLLLVSGCLDWSALYGPRCGNGVVEGSEVCDDGNQDETDACTSLCQLPSPYCGDGNVDPGETCDDGNPDDEDACLSNCQSAVCGDDHTWDGVEQCDDGNVQPGDGCSPGCQVESPTCGNSMLDPGEPCDDGNDSNEDSCLRGCSHAVCGDGFVRTGVEECDFGVSGGGTCTRGCQICANDAKSYSRNNARCYEYHGEAVTYGAARAVCAKKNGYVWTVTAAVEANDVLTHLTAATLDSWLSLNTSSVPYSWANGDSNKYQAWAAGQPANPALGCVLNHEDATLGSTWQSAACAEKHAFICERNLPNEDAVSHHAYRLRSDALPFDAARDACAALGGHLMSIESQAEQTQIGKWFSIELWLGATRSGADFQWVTGALVGVPTFFAQGQPDNASGSEDCLVFGKAHSWSDVDCTGPRAFVCEFE